MKRIAKVIILTVMMMLCMIYISSAQERIKVTEEEQLMDVFKHGGYAVLEENITIDSEDELRMNHDVTIDLNGHGITVWGEEYDVAADVCFMNGRVNLFGDSLSLCQCTMAVRNGLLNMSSIRVIMKPEAYLLEADNAAFIAVLPKQVSEPVARLHIDSEDISEETFLKIAKTGELPALEKDGYTFNGWQNAAGDTVTTWRGTTFSEYIHAVFSENTASVFGEGNVWKILTFVFFLSTVVLAILYVRRKK